MLHLCLCVNKICIVKREKKNIIYDRQFISAYFSDSFKHLKEMKNVQMEK